MRPTLVIMAKAPVAGRVKTRLAREIGTAAATSIYRAMQAAVIARLAHDPRWQTVLAVTPDSAVISPVFATNAPRVRQGAGNLGTRMQRLFDTVYEGPMLIIGTDIPSIAAADIAAAFRALQEADSVIAPASDGGYWLIGARRFPKVPRPFANVRWSSEHACEDTLANLATQRCVMLYRKDDLDTAADLAALGACVGRRILPRA